LPISSAAEPLAVAFPTEHDVVELPVEADLTADHGAARVEPGRSLAVDGAGRERAQPMGLAVTEMLSWPK
jgi:hypothetical protein